MERAVSAQSSRNMVVAQRVCHLEWGRKGLVAVPQRALGTAPARQGPNVTAI